MPLLCSPLATAPPAPVADCPPPRLRCCSVQVRSLRQLHHPCIVQLKEVVRENDELFFVFEYMVRGWLGDWVAGWVAG